MNDMTDIPDSTFGKAAYAHALVLQTMLISIVVQTAVAANPADPVSAARAMKSNMSGALDSPALRQAGDEELLALMNNSQEAFWAEVLGALTSAATPSGLRN